MKTKLKVTITQFNANKEHIENQWNDLKIFLKSNPTDLLLLPEMPFFEWICANKEISENLWLESIEDHNRYLSKLTELNVPIIAGTRPNIRDDVRYNTGFIWSKENGVEEVHDKVYLPNEEGFWESSWYSKGKAEFQLFEINGIRIGFLICTEIWFLRHARSYAESGIHILFVPRSTPLATTQKWLNGGQVAGVISGSYCLSSNHTGTAPDGKTILGGTGWISDPEGNLLGQTSEKNPFCNYEIDLDESEQAKLTYPRYVK